MKQIPQLALLSSAVALLLQSMAWSTPPAAPKGVRQTESSPAHIRVQWRDMADNETGYRIWRRERGKPWRLAGETEASVTQFDDGGMQQETVYQHKVAAFNDDGESEAVAAHGSTCTPRMQSHLKPLTVVPAGALRAHSPSALSMAEGHILLAYTLGDGIKLRNWRRSSIWLRTSPDDGLTWAEPRPMVEGTDEIAFAKPALVRLPSGQVGISYSQFRLDEKAKPAGRLRFFRRSEDGGLTWSEAVPMAESSANNDTLIVADHGRLLQPLNDGQSPRALLAASDDQGATWRIVSEVAARKPAWPTGESALVHAGEGRLVLLSRHEAPYYCLNFSPDNGATWESPHTLWLGGGDNPPKIARLPGTDLLVAVVHSWCDGVKRKDRRQFASLVSANGGRTWENFRLIGFAPDGQDGFLQHSLTFAGDMVLIFYGSGSKNDAQDGKDLCLLRLHKSFFTSKTPWPYDWQGRPLKTS